MVQVKRFIPTASLVTTPEVHLFDETANVIIMDDCGEGILSLRTLLLRDEAIPVPVARTIGAALGIFLAQVHSWGRAEAVVNLFDGNAQARTLSAWVTYGRVVSTLTDATRPPALHDPSLDLSEGQLATITDIADEAANLMRTTKEGVIHGDFWPGNILVALSGEGADTVVERIWVVDWELAKPGLPGFDVGQFCAEVHLARRFFPAGEAAASAVLETFLKAYRAGNDEQSMYRLAGVAQTHLAAHLIVITPKNATWQDKNTVREVVLEGVRYFLSAGEEEQDFTHSIFGPLLGTMG